MTHWSTSASGVILVLSLLASCSLFEPIVDFDEDPRDLGSDDVGVVDVADAASDHSDTLDMISTADTDLADLVEEDLHDAGPESCEQGMCDQNPTLGINGPCSSDNDCPTGADCSRDVVSGITGGACLLECGEDNPCPDDHTCVDVSEHVRVFETHVCALLCETDEDCERDGWECNGVCDPF